MSDATPNPHNTFVDSVVQRLETAECEDSHGKPIGGMTDLEKGVMLQFILQMAAIGSGVTRIALNLPAGVRKHVVLYAGILPLIKADAERTGRSILYLAPNSNAEAGAKLEFSAMFPFTLGTRVEFNTWEAIEPSYQNGNKTTPLQPFWIIGDLDTREPLRPDPKTPNIDFAYLDRLIAAKNSAVSRVLRDGACPTLMLHQEGQHLLIGKFPPDFSSKPAGKGGCFIATVACGSPYAEEVNLLRGFRDEVLAPRAIGRAAVAVYERFSPPLARWIETRPAVRKAVRGLLIRPLARMLGGKRPGEWKN
jgi:hypothetical protein